MTDIEWGELSTDEIRRRLKQKPKDILTTTVVEALLDRIDVLYDEVTAIENRLYESRN
jgi:hypothetical protein